MLKAMRHNIEKDGDLDSENLKTAFFKDRNPPKNSGRAQVNFIGPGKKYVHCGSTVNPVYNDHPQDPKFVAVVDKWSLFSGRFML